MAGGDRLLPCADRSAGPQSGPSPVDRARPGSKHHVLTGGNRHDVTQLLPLLDKVPAVAGVVGRPRRRPDALLADRGYDHDTYRPLLWTRGICPVIAERGQEHGFGPGIFRYVVERTIARLHGFRRLRIRRERRCLWGHLVDTRGVPGGVAALPATPVIHAGDPSGSVIAWPRRTCGLPPLFVMGVLL